MDAFHKYILHTITSQEQRDDAEKEAYNNFQKHVVDHTENPWPKDMPKPNPYERLVGNAFIKWKMKEVGAKNVADANKANDWRLQPLIDHYKLNTGTVKGPTAPTRNQDFVGHIRNGYDKDGGNYYVLHGVHCENTT